jgi:hypothetical protein
VGRAGTQIATSESGLAMTEGDWRAKEQFIKAENEAATQYISIVVKNLIKLDIIFNLFFGKIIWKCR